MLHQIGRHVWYTDPYHPSDRPALGYICGSHMAFAVDAGASEAHVRQFYESLAAEELPLPDLTGISHHHWDHSYGAAFTHGLTSASDKCADALRREASYMWTKEDMQRRLDAGDDIFFCYWSKLMEYPDLSRIRVTPPDLVLHGDMSVDLGGVTVEILYCGGPHSDDHLIFYIPEDKVLFLSDASGKAIFSLEWEFDPQHPELLQDTLSKLPYDLEKLEPFVALLRRLDFTRCVLGHADHVLTREELMADLERPLGCGGGPSAPLADIK